MMCSEEMEKHAYPFTLPCILFDYCVATLMKSLYFCGCVSLYRFDLCVTLVSIAGLFGDIFQDNFFFFIILRPFRLVRLDNYAL